MKSRFKKLAVGAVLLSASALAYASTTDCWCCVQAYFSALCIQ